MSTGLLNTLVSYQRQVKFEDQFISSLMGHLVVSITHQQLRQPYSDIGSPASALSR